MQVESSSVSFPFWAFLVGINEYQNQQELPRLRGCVNDIEAIQTLLIDKFLVPQDHIRTLINQQATRDAIIGTFQEFLIENPALVHGAQLLFYFSGHGSRMIDTTHVEPDGYNETIVPYDSRTSNVYDIPDKTLAALLSRLADKKGENITVVLDCCHSGSGTRDIRQIAQVREVSADERLPPPELDADLLTKTPTRNVGPSGWAEANFPYVLLAGCQEREFANEHPWRNENGVEVWNGALTYFLQQWLSQLAPGTTYADLHERIATQVNALYRSQNPQCEGDRSRLVFKGMRVERDPFISVREISKDTVTLAAGLVHGLRPGTELALYPPETRRRDDLPATPLATVRVKEVRATTASAQLLQGNIQNIPLHARGLITRQVYESIWQPVVLTSDKAKENQQVIARLRDVIEHTPMTGLPSPYLKLVERPAQATDLQVVATSGMLSIYDAQGELLVTPEAIQEQGSDDVVATLHALESIARYRTLLDLTNLQPGSQLAGKVKLRLRAYRERPQGALAEELPPSALSPGGELNVSYDPEHEEQNIYVIDVVNNSPYWIYPHIFALSPDYSIQRVYPRFGEQDAFKPGDTFPCGFNIPEERLRCYLPEGWDASRDSIKAFVTTQPADLGILEQGPLTVPIPETATRSVSSPLDQLLDALLQGAGNRHTGPARPSTQEDWTTAELRMTTVRASHTTPLDAGMTEVALSDGVTLTKPREFQGRIAVTTLSQATRGTAGDSMLVPPPGLNHFPDLFEPVERLGTRNVGPTQLVIALDIDEASRVLVTPDQPLELKLPDIYGRDIFAMAFDGEDYLLVGSTDGTEILKVTTLPPMAVAPSRGMGHALKLFLYKQVGHHTEVTGLHRAALENGSIISHPVERSMFQPGQHVALFVHGFTSDTGWMVRGIAQFLQKEVLPYDHLLTWNYESFGTGIAECGNQLALALQQQCGFSSEDGIKLHVYAHSMGCLVSRSMIELAGGHQFVDRLVMAGPPNRGTTLATLSRSTIYIANALINNYAIVPPLGILNAATKGLYKAGHGWADLAVDSPLIQQLNALQEPGSVPYLVLAGVNVPDGQGRHRLDRLARKTLGEGLDALFGEENDTVVGLSSMKGVRGGTYRLLSLDVLPCDHFHYYDIALGREIIKNWILNQ